MFKKVELEYRSAFPVSKKNPGVKVKRSELVKLDRVIKEKCEQNALERQKGEELASNYLVKKLVNKK